MDDISIGTESQKHHKQISNTTDLLEYTQSYLPEMSHLSEEFNFKLLKEDEFN